jgi:hypothetical protein
LYKITLLYIERHREREREREREMEENKRRKLKGKKKDNSFPKWLLWGTPHLVLSVRPNFVS